MLFSTNSKQKFSRRTMQTTKYNFLKCHRRAVITLKVWTILTVQIRYRKYSFYIVIFKVAIFITYLRNSFCNFNFSNAQDMLMCIPFDIENAANTCTDYSDPSRTIRPRRGRPSFKVRRYNNSSSLFVYVQIILLVSNCKLTK